VQVLAGHRLGILEADASRQIGPNLVFGRLWREHGLDRGLTDVPRERGFEFPVERAVYLTVIHQLFESGRTGPRINSAGTSASPGPRTWGCPTCIGPYGGWVTTRMRWKMPWFGVAGICSPNRSLAFFDVCWVADRGMISRETFRELEARSLEYILGVRLRSHRQVRPGVLGRAGRYQKVAGNLNEPNRTFQVGARKIGHLWLSTKMILQGWQI